MKDIIYYFFSDNPGFVILPFIIFSIMWFPYFRIKREIQKGNIPKFLRDFPIHIASEESLNLTNVKLKNFLNLVLQKKDAEIKLDSNDINNIYTGDEVVNIFVSANHHYYDISDNRIIEHFLLWPFPDFQGYIRSIKEIKFFLKDGKYFQKVINLDTKDEGIILLASCSALLLLIFSNGLRKVGDIIIEDDRKSPEYKNFISVVDNISYLGVDNNKFIIKMTFGTLEACS